MQQINIRKILKKFKPAILLLDALRSNIASKQEIDELSSLIHDGRYIILNPSHNMIGDYKNIYNIIHLVIEDHFTVFKTVSIANNITYKLKLPYNTVLLRRPLAMIEIPCNHQEYLALIGDKTRNMIRRAQKEGYEIKEFTWNDHLDDIFQINTSREVRSSGVMRGWYRLPVQPRHHNEDEQKYMKYYGVFKEGKLYAYLHIVLCGDHAFFRHFIGHANHLKYGIMNALISWAVNHHIGTQIRWLNYGKINGYENNSAANFKRRAGFRGYATFIDVKQDAMLMKYSKKVRSISWKSITA